MSSFYLHSDQNNRYHHYFEKVPFKLGLIICLILGSSRPPHIPEHCPFRLQIEQSPVISHTFSLSSRCPNSPHHITHTHPYLEDCTNPRRHSTNSSHHHSSSSSHHHPLSRSSLQTKRSAFTAFTSVPPVCQFAQDTSSEYLIFCSFLSISQKWQLFPGF